MSDIKLRTPGHSLRIFSTYFTTCLINNVRTVHYFVHNLHKLIHLTLAKPTNTHDKKFTKDKLHSIKNILQLNH